MGKNIRLGVVGCGSRISSVINHYIRPQAPADRPIQVAAVVDPDEAGAHSRVAEADRASVKFYRTLDEMVRRAKLDALLIGTRCNLHADFAVQAAKYDLPLYLEKPVAVNMEQAVALERAFEKSRCQVVVSFPLRVSPLAEKARALIAANAVGTPVHVNAVNYVPYGTVYWEEGYRNYAVTQGLFLQKATHDLDCISYLMGEPVVRVAAMGSFQKVFGGDKPAGLRCSACGEQWTCLESHHNRRRHGLNKNLRDHLCVYSVDCGTLETGTNEDCSSALLEFASGAHGVYTQVFFARRDAAARGATVSGHLGTLSFDWYTNQIRRVCHHEPFTEVVKAGDGGSHFGGDIELADDFLGLITGRLGEPRSTLAMGLQSVYTCLAAKDSLRLGRFVKVRQAQGSR